MSKKEIINLSILISILSLFIVILIMNGRVFGSELDWKVQHFSIAEYFRTLFYSDFKLFPDFSFNIGGGQNIYNFAYYGLLSPIVIFSYLLPFIKMIDYIQISSIIMYFFSILLFYKWLKNNNKHSDVFFETILFSMATPLLFHAHRHIMFVNYMPFLILSFMGVDNIILKNKSSLFLISTILLIFTNYFFAVSSLVAIFIYYIYKIIDIKKINITSIFVIIKKIFLIVVTSSVLLIPTAYTLLSGRNDSNVMINFFDLILPSFKTMTFMYTPYSMGLTTFFLVVLISTFTKSSKADKFLAVIFSLIFAFPIFIYFLNGMMYINAKVLIPFIPLFIIMVQNIYHLNKKEVLQTLIIYLTLALLLMKSVYSTYKYLYIIDLIITTIALFDFYKRKNINIFKICIVLISILTFIKVNLGDNLVLKEDVDNIFKIENKINNYNINEASIYRISDNINKFDTINSIPNLNIYKTSIYSSISNGYYNNFFFNTFNNEISYRNSAITLPSDNIMFNTFMGIKYMIIDKEIPFYEKADNLLHINKYAFPIIYKENKTINKKEFEKLKFPFNNEALLNYTVLDDTTNSNYETNIEEFKLEYEKIIKKGLELEKKDNGYIINSIENGFLNLKLKEPVKDKVIFIRFNMDYNQSCSKEDSTIKINNVTNKLTCKTWKYHNNNYTFEYVISNEKEVSNLNINFSEGRHEISNIELYTLSFEKIKEARLSKQEFIFDNEKTKGNNIEGSIVTDSEGIVATTIPYDKGFTIKVNDKLTEPMLVNDAFLGFKINQKNNKIVINYEAPFLKESKIISLFGIIAITVNVILERRKNNNEKNIANHTLL